MMRFAFARSGISRCVRFFLAAGMIVLLTSGSSRAGTVLSTGLSTAPTGGPENAIDLIWNVSYTDPTLGTVTTEGTKVVADPGFPFPAWIANSADSKWLIPVSFTRENAPPPAGSPPLSLRYSASFVLTEVEAEALNSTGWSGRWSSDNNGVGISLNDYAQSLDTGTTAYRSWHDFTIDSGFLAGVNTLSFTVLNQPQNSGNPTGFRMEGTLPYGAIVPEPSGLSLALVGLGALGVVGFGRRIRPAT